MPWVPVQPEVCSKTLSDKTKQNKKRKFLRVKKESGLIGERRTAVRRYLLELGNGYMEFIILFCVLL